MKKIVILLTLSTIALMTVTGCSKKSSFKQELEEHIIQKKKDEEEAKSKLPKKGMLNEDGIEYDNFIIEGSENFDEIVNGWNIIEDSFKQEVSFDATLNDGAIRGQKNKLRMEHGLKDKDIWLDGWYAKNAIEIKEAFDTEVNKYGFSSSEESTSTNGDIVIYEGLSSHKKTDVIDSSIIMIPYFGQTTIRYRSSIKAEDYTEEFKDNTLIEIKELLGLDINKEQMDLIVNKYLNFTEEETDATRRKGCSCAELKYFGDAASVSVELTAHRDVKVINISVSVNGSGEPDVSNVFGSN